MYSATSLQVRMAGDDGGMTIETKFELGEPVFYMDGNKVMQSTVDEVTVNVTWTNGPSSNWRKSIRIRPSDPYRQFEKRHMDEVDESKCFRTKEELIASL